MWQYFVAGLNEKAGTTWMQIMLNAHPESMCKSESDFVMLIDGFKWLHEEHDKAVKAKTHEYHRDWYAPTPNMWVLMWANLVQMAMHQETVKNPSIKYVGDKTPNYGNYLRMLIEVFKDAKFVVLQRDVRDVAASGWQGELKHNPKFIQEKFDGSMPKYAQAVLYTATHRAKQYAAAKQYAPDRIRLVKYEDLLFDVKGEMTRVSEFLFDEVDNVTAMCKAGKWESLTGGRKRGQEDPESFFRKGTKGDYKNVLCLKSIEILEAGMDEISQLTDSSILAKS